MFVFTKLLFVLILNFNLCNCKNYSNYALLRATPTEDDHLKFFENLPELYDVDIWRQVGLKDKPVDFLISPIDYNAFAKKARRLGINYKEVINDIEEAFKKQTIQPYNRRNMESYDFQHYFTLPDMYQWLKDMRKLHQGYMELIKIGKTFEGRDLIAAKVDFSKDSKLKPTIIVEGGIHAREWISSAFVTYMLRQIVNAKSSHDQVFRDIAFGYTWYFVPMMNPDGFDYTQKEDRMWRKNRNADGPVDINRNFDADFGTIGVSFEKNRDIYCGKKPFSEAESTAMKELVTRHAQTLRFYLAYHSYGQHIVLPFAYSKKHVLNYDEVYRLGLLASAAIQKRFKTHYKVGTAYDTVGYMTSGVSGCWVKKKFNVPYIITLELRDNGTYGFALPPREILPTCRETLDGMIAFISAAEKSYKAKQKDRLEEIHKTNSQDRVAFDIVSFILNTLLLITIRYD